MLGSEKCLTRNQGAWSTSSPGTSTLATFTHLGRLASLRGSDRDPKIRVHPRLWVPGTSIPSSADELSEELEY